MTNKKRIISIVLIVALVAALSVALAACGNNSTTVGVTAGSKGKENEVSATIKKNSTLYVNLGASTREGTFYNYRYYNTNGNLKITVQTKNSQSASWSDVTNETFSKRNAWSSQSMVEMINWTEPKNGRLNSRQYRLKIVPSADTTVKVRMSEYVDSRSWNGKTSYVWRPAASGNDSGDMTVQYVAYFTKSDANLLGKIWKHSSFKQKVYLLNGDGKTISQKALNTILGELKSGLAKSISAQIGKDNDKGEIVTDFTINLASSLVKAIWKLVDAGNVFIDISKKLASTTTDIQFTVKTNSEGFYFVYFNEIKGNKIYGAPAQVGIAYGKNNSVYRQFVPYAEV